MTAQLELITVTHREARGAESDPRAGALHQDGRRSLRDPRRRLAAFAVRNRLLRVLRASAGAAGGERRGARGTRRPQRARDRRRALVPRLPARGLPGQRAQPGQAGTGGVPGLLRDREPGRGRACGDGAGARYPRRRRRRRTSWVSRPRRTSRRGASCCGRSATSPESTPMVPLARRDLLAEKGRFAMSVLWLEDGRLCAACSGKRPPGASPAPGGEIPSGEAPPHPLLLIRLHP